MLRFLVLLLTLSGLLRLSSQTQAQSFPLPALEPITTENAARLQELTVIGRGEFASVDLSPDGNTLAVGTTAGVWFYDFNDLSAEPTYLYTGVGFNSDVRFDITGKYLQVVTYLPDVGNGTSTLWEISEDFKQSKVLGEGKVSVDRRYLLQPDSALIDAITGQQLQFEIPKREDAVLPFEGDFAISPSTKLVAIVKSNTGAGNRRAIALHDLHSTQVLATLSLLEESNSLQLGSLAFTPDGEFLLGALVDITSERVLTTIRIWPVADLIDHDVSLVESGRIIWQVENRSISKLQTFDDVLLVETRTSPEYLRSTDIVSLADGVIQKHIDNDIVQIHLSSHDILAFKNETIDQLQIRNEMTDEIIGTLTSFGDEITDFQLNAAQTQALVTTQWSDTQAVYTSTYLLDTQTWRPLNTTPTVTSLYSLARFQPDGRAIQIMLTSAQTGANYLEIRDVRTGQVIYTFPEPFLEHPSLDLSTNGRFLIVWTDDLGMLYDITQPETPQPIALPEPELGNISLHPDSQGRYLIQIERNGRSRFLRVWDIMAEQEVARINNRRFQTAAGRRWGGWATDGEILILCEKMDDNNDMLLSFWGFAELLTDPYVNPVLLVGPNFCTYETDGTHLIAIPTYGDGVSVWDMRGTQHIMTVGDEDRQWWRLAKFSPDGSVIFGIQYFGSMTAWNLNGESIATFDFAPWPVRDILFMDEGRLMVMPGSDGTIRLWGVPSEDGE
jgi:WD40 repeat protein